MKATNRKTLTLTVTGKLARLEKLMHRKTGKELTNLNVGQMATSGVCSEIYGAQTRQRAKLEDTPEQMPCMYQGKESTYGTVAMTEEGRLHLEAQIEGHLTALATHQRRVLQKQALLMNAVKRS
jgi:hypothetical protein